MKKRTWQNTRELAMRRAREFTAKNNCYALVVRVGRTFRIHYDFSLKTAEYWANRSAPKGYERIAAYADGWKLAGVYA